MKSLRTRLTVRFGLMLLILVAAFTCLTRLSLEIELRHQTWQQAFPDHPDWKLQGSFLEAEVGNFVAEKLMESAMIWFVPLVVAALAGGYWLARLSLRPVASVNRQLRAKNSSNLGEPIRLPELDHEFKALVGHLNELLSRLDESFSEMNDYAAKVAHELRTPLTILRLKIEQAGGRIDPALAEALENELQRLSYVVEQSLLIARAERGHLPLQHTTFDLADVVRDVVADFQLLAAERGRQLSLLSAPECRIRADARHIRQIIHSLLTNALKHGQGDLRVRIRCRSGCARLLIFNRTSQKPGTNPEALGLGLRVVAALLRRESSIHYFRRRGRDYYIARLQIHLAAPEEEDH